MNSPSDYSRSQSQTEVWFYGGVRRACDRCRLRKIRCDAQKPCSICSKAAHSCTYEYVPKKKGPRRTRGKLAESLVNPSSHDRSSPSCIQSPAESSNPESSTSSVLEYFDTLTDTTGRAVGLIPTSGSLGCSTLSLATKVHNFRTESLDSFASPRGHDTNLMISCPMEYSKSNSHSPILQRDRIPTEVLLPFIELFFDKLFPIMPVLDRHLYLRSNLLRRHPLPSEEYALLTAMSAVTIVQLNIPAEEVQQNLPGLTAEFLVKESLYERRLSDYIEHPGTNDVLTSFFLFGYYGNVEKHNKARYFLHEAISFAESLDLDDECYLTRLDDPRRAQLSRRIFWLLFITERFFVINPLPYIIDHY